MRYIYVLLFSICLLSIPARADTINHVQAVATFNLNNGGQLLFASSFDWDATTNTLVPGTVVTESFGLGTFLANTFRVNFASWVNEFHDAIQINFRDHGQPETFDDIGIYAGGNTELWGAGGLFLGPHLSPSADSGYISVIPVATTEPPTGVLILVGVIVVLGIRCLR